MNPLRNALAIIKKRDKKYYFIIAAVFLLLFLNSFYAGQHFYQTETQKAIELMEKIQDSPKVKLISDAIIQGEYSKAATIIFFNNFLIDVVSMYLGVIPLIPLFVLFVNAIFLGNIFGIQSLLEPIDSVFHIVIILLVGIIELSSMVIISYEGVRIGIGIIKPSLFGKGKRGKIFLQNLSESTQVLFLVMILLLLGAIVETTGIVVLGSRLTS